MSTPGVVHRVWITRESSGKVVQNGWILTKHASLDQSRCPEEDRQGRAGQAGQGRQAGQDRQGRAGRAGRHIFKRCVHNTRTIIVRDTKKARLVAIMRSTLNIRRANVPCVTLNRYRIGRRIRRTSFRPTDVAQTRAGSTRGPGPGPARSVKHRPMGTKPSIT